MLLDDERLLGQLQEVGIVDGELVAIVGRNIDGLDAFTAARLAVNHLDGFGTERAAQDGRVARLQRRFVNIELVGIHRALHDGLAQAIRSGDEDDVAEAGISVEREHHAARADVRTAHVLNASGQRDHVVVETLVHAIGDGAIVVERGEHFVHALDQRFLAAHVEECFLLTGERRVRQVFGGGGGAHRDGDIATFTHALVAGEDFLLQLRRERCRQNPLTDLRADLGELLDVFDIERGEFLGDTLGQAFVLEEVAISLRGGRVTGRHAHAHLGQMADHLAERGILPPTVSTSWRPSFFEGYCVGGQGRSS